MYPIVSVNVNSMSEKRFHNVHITSRAGQCQGALSLPRNCFGVCTLKEKEKTKKKTNEHQ